MIGTKNSEIQVLDSYPEISIIVNCHNGGAYLAQALDSVVFQNWKDFELIFVDNHSTDDSRKIFDSYHDVRFRCVVPDRFVPLGEARNFGVVNCRGKFISFLDADDIWEPDKLSLQITELVSTGVDALYTQAKMFYPDGRELPYSRRQISADISFGDLVTQFDLCLSTLVLRKSFLHRLDWIFHADLEVAEDADLLLRIAHLGRVRFLSEVTVRYRVHGNSDSWRKPEAFLGDLDRMSDCYRSVGMDADALAPLFDTAYWVVTMARWAEGNRLGARRALAAIRRRGLRTFLMQVLIEFPYRLVAPILRSAGKRVI